MVLRISIRALVIICRGDDTPLEASPSHHFGNWCAVSSCCFPRWRSRGYRLVSKLRADVSFPAHEYHPSKSHLNYV